MSLENTVNKTENISKSKLKIIYMYLVSEVFRYKFLTQSAEDDFSLAKRNTKRKVKLMEKCKKYNPLSLFFFN